MDINWLATALGFLAAFALTFLWFGPLFGRAWAAGSHGITRPDRLPGLALVLYAAGVGCLALVIGATATIDAIGTALAAIGGAAALVGASAMFSQKSRAAVLIDGGCVVVMGALMIAAQGLL